MKPSKFILRVSAVLALAAVPVLGYFGYRWQQQQSLEKEYNDTLAQLLRPRQDGGPDSARPAGLLKDLNNLIERKAGGDAALRRKLREDVAGRFIELFESESFNLGQGANAELETRLLAGDDWKEYPDYLASHPDKNVRVMYKYSVALEDLARRDPDFVRTAVPLPDHALGQKKPVKNSGDVALLQILNFGYRHHLALLGKFAGQTNKDYLLTSFCWYLNATDNPSLAGDVFDYSPTQVGAEEHRCAERDQSLKTLE